MLLVPVVVLISITNGNTSDEKHRRHASLPSLSLKTWNVPDGCRTRRTVDDSARKDHVNAQLHTAWQLEPAVGS